MILIPYVSYYSFGTSYLKKKIISLFAANIIEMVSPNYIDKIGSLLNNQNYPLKCRFRALFTLKNIGGTAAIDYIAKCFSDKSALLKHELAYCLGQMKDPYAVPILTELLEDISQETVVRHEAGKYYSILLQTLNR